MTKHTDTSRSGDLKPCPFCGGEAVDFYRANTGATADWCGPVDHWVCCTGECGASTCMHGTKDEAIAAWNTRTADRIEALEAENERLRKLTCATWFYMPDEGDRCWFSPHEVIDEMYDPEPGNHVFEVECATSLPSIWCAVRVTDDPDADERFTFTEHETEAEARAALGEKQ